MAASNKRQKDSWSDGMAKFAEAPRHNMTATNLAAAGAIALGAAAFAYFWDEERRNAFIDMTRRFTGDVASRWGEAGSAAPSVNQKPPPLHPPPLPSLSPP